MGGVNPALHQMMTDAERDARALRDYWRDQRPKFVAPKPGHMEVIPAYIQRVVAAFEEWANA